MADKRRYTVSLPDHVADAVEKHARPLGSTPTEYAADVVRWWFGQGCPPVTPDETALRSARLAEEIARRVKPLPKDLDVWRLEKDLPYILTGEEVVKKLLNQLGLPNLFAQQAEYDNARFSVAFDNHPTHWLQFDFFKGTDRLGGDGLSFIADPKSSVTRHEMLERLKSQANEMGWKGTISFSQIPDSPTKAAGQHKRTIAS